MPEVKLTRRQFFQVTGAGLGASSMTVMGLANAADPVFAKPNKLEKTTETRSTCPYCSVSCGVLMYSRKDASGKLKVMHVEGDPDNPVNKGTLCPKGAGILDMVESPNRLQFPEVREPGSNTWKRISWDEALTRITKRMKADRDQNFVAKNAAGVTVNRWNTFGMLVSSASNNEAGYLSAKVLRSLGVVALDTQARI
jgi:formate dehydrogenase major subunit